MSESLSLFSNSGRQAPLLLDLWDRSSMDLTDEQFHAKFPTVKDLEKVWKALPWTPPTAYKPPSAADDLSSASSAASSNGDADEDGAGGKGKKWSYRDTHWSQYDTILVDDSPDKACLQPYNHLQIPAYKPHNLQTANQQHQYNGPRGMSGRGGAGQDTCLLQLVGMLDALRCHTNVSRAINAGHFHGLGVGDVQHAWTKKGKDVLIRAGITVSENFDRGWSNRLLGVS